jgi:hypothetical protein
MAVVIVAMRRVRSHYQYCVIMCAFVTIVSSVSTYHFTCDMFPHCLYCSNVVACVCTFSNLKNGVLLIRRPNGLESADW